MSSMSTAELQFHNWQWWLNNTALALGMQNVFDTDLPLVAGNLRTATMNR